MTADEQTILRIYLLRIGAISSEEDFEEWHRVSTDSKEGKAATVTLLEMARAYNLGLRDAKLQAEAWVEGIDRTYDLIIKGLIAERQLLQREISNPAKPPTGSPWLYLPVGPEGPRPWGNAPGGVK